MKHKKLILIAIPLVFAAFLILSYANCEQKPLVLLGYQIHQVTITTDKAEYKPGETVYFTMKNTGSMPVNLASSSGGLGIKLDYTENNPRSIDAPANRVFYPCENIKHAVTLIVEKDEPTKPMVPVEPGEYEAS
ncbi:MAG: hypothetical protein ACREAK_07015, partial [Nitrosarchaeum sp.]